MKYSFRGKLFETQTLLAEANEERWSGVLADLLARYDQSPSGVRKGLLSLYAHQNSFSDFVLDTGDAGASETSRRFDRLRAELHRACIDEENASQGIAAEESFDLRQLAIEVTIVAVSVFLLRIANPVNFGIPAGTFDYLSLAVMAIAWSVGLCAAYRTARTILRGEQPEGPGQYVALGFGAMVAYACFFDLFLAVWSRIGAGIPEFDSFDLAIQCAGVALPAAAMLYGARQPSVEPPWRHALLAGAVLFATYLLPAGLYAIQWIVRIAGGPIAALEAVAAIGYVLTSFVLGIAGLGWLAYVTGIYARERSNGERYPWMHHAPLVMWGLSLLAIATVALQYAIRD